MTQQYTPTPWISDTASGQLVIREISAGNKGIAAFPTSEENSAFIVRAVNNHDSLIQALERLLDGHSIDAIETALSAIDKAKRGI